MSRYQVGDLVKVTGDEAGWDHDFAPGTEGVVIEVFINGDTHGTYPGTYDLGYSVQSIDASDEEWDVSPDDLVKQD